MKRITSIVGGLLFLVLGLFISIDGLSPPNTGYKTVRAAELPSIKITPMSFTDLGKEPEPTKVDTIYEQILVEHEKPVIIVTAPKPDTVVVYDTILVDSSSIMKEPIQIKLIMNDSILFLDSINMAKCMAPDVK